MIYNYYDKKDKTHSRTYKSEKVDNYSIICARCGNRRGEHYSKDALTFCNHDDLKHYVETGIITDGRRFIPVGSKKPIHKYKSEITKNVRVIMDVGDGWTNKGTIGIVESREGELVKIHWDNGSIYFHNVDCLSLLKNSKDPNILFLMRKNR